MHDPRPAALVALWEGAVSHLEFEMRMVHLRIEHSAVMNRLREPEKPRSALYLAEPFTPTDLMELITALHTALLYFSSFASITGRRDSRTSLTA